MVTVKLSKPITVPNLNAKEDQPKERQVSELTFRPATVGDLIAGETVGRGIQTAVIAATLASMAEIPYPVFKTISAGDYSRINKATVGLVGNEEEDGAN